MNQPLQVVEVQEVRNLSCLVKVALLHEGSVCFKLNEVYNTNVIHSKFSQVNKGALFLLTMNEFGEIVPFKMINK